MHSPPLFTQPPRRRILGSSSTIKTGAPATGRLRPRESPGSMRSGYPDGELALDVVCGERLERIGRLVELVGPLDGNPERPGLEQSREPLQVLRGRHRHDVVTLRSFAGRRERRGSAAIVL